MYAKGMTTRQISETIEDIYGFETSEGFISDVTDKILPRILLQLLVAKAEATVLLVDLEDDHVNRLAHLREL